MEWPDGSQWLVSRRSHSSRWLSRSVKHDCRPAATSRYVMSSFLRGKIDHGHDADRFSSAPEDGRVRRQTTWRQGGV